MTPEHEKEIREARMVGPEHPDAAFHFGLACGHRATLLQALDQERERRNALRLTYAGAIGLLARLMVHVPDAEDRDLCEQACLDWAAQTGWGVKRILNCIELLPPRG